MTLCLPFHHRLDEQDDSTGINENFIPFNNRANWIRTSHLLDAVCWLCQFGCGILKMVGPKMQDFCPRIDMLKGNCFKTILWWIMVRQKVPKSYFQSQISMSKINRIFSKKIISEYQFRRPFFVKNFFFNEIFEPLYFLKSCPSFWRTVIQRIHKIQWFPFI